MMYNYIKYVTYKLNIIYKLSMLLYNCFISNKLKSKNKKINILNKLKNKK